jgi:hypothetical protein
MAKELLVGPGAKNFLRALLDDEAVDMDESEMSEADANDHAVSLIGVPDEDIGLRHDAFDAAANALIAQARSFDPELGRKAYQLLLEMHARGAPIPVHIQLPSMTWELKAENIVLSVSVMIMAIQWDFLINGATAAESICEEGHHRGSARQFAKFVMTTFERRERSKRGLAALDSGATVVVLDDDLDEEDED